MDDDEEPRGKVIAFESDPVAPVRVLVFTAPANRRLKITTYQAPPTPDREWAVRNPSFILVEDLGDA